LLWEAPAREKLDAGLGHFPPPDGTALRFIAALRDDQTVGKCRIPVQHPHAGQSGLDFVTPVKMEGESLVASIRNFCRRPARSSRGFTHRQIGQMNITDARPSRFDVCRDDLAAICGRGRLFGSRMPCRRSPK
jgi:hypothetical protein